MTLMLQHQHRISVNTANYNVKDAVLNI